MNSIKALLDDNCLAPMKLDEISTYIDEECPELLLDGELVQIGFRQKGGSGYSFFTSRRILLLEKLGSGVQTKYLSLPYDGIKAFDVELFQRKSISDRITYYYSGCEEREVSMDFIAAVDVSSICTLLGEKVLQDIDGRQSIGHFDKHNASPFTSIMNSNNGANIFGMIDSWQLRERFDNILLREEKIQLGYKNNNVSIIFTNLRMVKITERGKNGSKSECLLSIRWRSIKSFSVQVPSSRSAFEFCEMFILTNIAGLSRIEIGTEAHANDVYIIQTFLADKLHEKDGVQIFKKNHQFMNSLDASSSALTEISTMLDGDHVLAYLEEENTFCSAPEIDRAYHQYPPILEQNETVDLAFKERRDLIVFTSSRILIVNFQNLASHGMMDYTTIPWRSIQSYGISFAGTDTDSNIFVWTDVNDVICPEKENFFDADTKPIPRLSFVNFRLRMDEVNLIVVQRILSERCIYQYQLYRQSDQRTTQDMIASILEQEGSRRSLVEKKGSKDVFVINLDAQVEALMGDNEEVLMYFQTGRKMIVFTEYRIITIEVKDTAGTSNEYLFIPYSKIRAYSIKSKVGDLESEVKLFCGTFWNYENNFKINFFDENVSIIQIQSILSWYVLGPIDELVDANHVSYKPISGGGALIDFLEWIDDIKDNTADVTLINDKFHSSPKVLNDDEIVFYAIKRDRNICAFTEKRILFVDRQGWDGKEIELTSYPMVSFTCFNIKSKGLFEPCGLTLHSDIPRASSCKQELNSANDEVWKVHCMLGEIFLTTDSHDESQKSCTKSAFDLFI